MKKLASYRHGEIALVQIQSLPEGIQKTNTKVFMVGSHGHDHSIDRGELYILSEQDGHLFGYLVAKETSLFHPEHSPDGCKIKDGVYELLKQHEYTPEGLKPIID